MNIINVVSSQSFISSSVRWACFGCGLVPLTCMVVRAKTCRLFAQTPFDRGDMNRLLLLMLLSLRTSGTIHLDGS